MVYIKLISISAILFCFQILTSCREEKKLIEVEKKLSDTYKNSTCFEELFHDFQNDIDSNQYSKLTNCQFCSAKTHNFNKNDFDLLGIKYSDSLSSMLTDFYEFTNVSEKVIFKVSRDGNSFIAFGGSPVGASGQYSDYFEWILIDFVSSKLIKNSQTSLSKNPFVFFYDSTSTLNFINYDYERGYDGFVNVREGKIPLVVSLELLLGKDNLKSQIKDKRFYCSDSNFF